MKKEDRLLLADRMKKGLPPPSIIMTPRGDHYRVDSTTGQIINTKRIKVRKKDRIKARAHAKARVDSKRAL